MYYQVEHHPTFGKPTTVQDPPCGVYSTRGLRRVPASSFSTSPPEEAQERGSVLLWLTLAGVTLIIIGVLWRSLEGRPERSRDDSGNNGVSVESDPRDRVDEEHRSQQ